jgi:phosphoglycolate phosphatase-like HAD superfamily hydrolase
VIIFDLDGCLINSEPVIRAAYRDAGVEPPEDFMSRTGHDEWLTGPDREKVHSVKNASYLSRLATGGLNLLPPFRVAMMFKEIGREVAILTGAPEGTVDVVKANAPYWPFKFAWDNCHPTRKGQFLAEYPSGTYIDDQRHVDIPAGWKFVHYTGQSAYALYDEVDK